MLGFEPQTGQWRHKQARPRPVRSLGDVSYKAGKMAFRCIRMTEPEWAHVNYEKPKFQEISYFAAPKKQYENWEDVDPEMKKTMDRLGISLEEQKKLSNLPKP